jgi:hypothetical protein
MGRKVRPQMHHVNNFIGLQKRFATDVLIFCSYDTGHRVLTVCGWITKEEFFQKASFYPAGTIRTRSDGTTFSARADLYEIENRDLYSPTTLSALKTDLSRLSGEAARREAELAA